MPSPKSTIEEKNHKCGSVPYSPCSGNCQNNTTHCWECGHCEPKGENVSAPVSPTWQEQEREAWEEMFNLEGTLFKSEFTIRYLISRLSLARKKLFDDAALAFQTKKDCWIEEGRKEAFAEVEEMLKRKTMGYYLPAPIEGLALNEILPERLGAMSYNDALKDALTSLSDLKKKGK